MWLNELLSVALAVSVVPPTPHPSPSSNRVTILYDAFGGRGRGLTRDWGLPLSWSTAANAFYSTPVITPRSSLATCGHSPSISGGWTSS